MAFALPWSRARPTKPATEPPAPALPPRAEGVLRELTPDERFGEMEIRPDNPVMHEFEDVCFVTDRPNGEWGVFSADGQAIPSSVDFNAPWCAPVWPPAVNVLRHADIPFLPDADYLYFGYIHGHFGHFLLDSLSRAWPYLEGGLQGRKLFFHGWGHPGHWWTEHPWLADIMAALGIAKTDLVNPTEPVRVKRLQIPGRSFQGQTFALQIHQRVCRTIGAAILETVDADRASAPIYLSKTRLKGGVRRVVNEHQLESFLRQRGVEIRYPETMSFAEQVAMFASGRTVTGTTTSGFHVSLFAPPAGRNVVIETGEVINSNHLIVDRLNGNRTSYQHAIGSRALPGRPEFWMVHEAFRDPVAIGRELLHLI